MPDGGAPDRLDDYLALAERLAEASAAIIRRWFEKGAAVEEKADETPVTQADREVEAAMRRIIAEAFPEHGIIGEEHGTEGGEADYVWVLDPIDGTKRFVAGQPWFGTLIALTRHARPIVGVIDIPMLEQRWVGAAGRRSLLRGRDGTSEVGTRPCPSLAAAILSSTSPDMFQGPAATAFDRLRRAVKYPLYGGDCYSYGTLASGRLDLVVEAGMGVYDFMALVPVVEGAGGRITDWQGAPLTLGSGDQVLAVGDPRLHEAALARLAAG